MLTFIFNTKLTIKKRYSQSHSQGLVQGDLENKTKSNWEKCATNDNWQSNNKYRHGGSIQL